jgi:ribosomal protein L40E
LGGGQILIKCFNPQCKQAYALTAEEAAKIQAEDLMALMPPAVGSPPTTVCIKCGKKTAYVAKKCDKCPEIFVRGEAGDRQYPDKCTKCGYSYAAELSKNQK